MRSGRADALKRRRWNCAQFKATDGLATLGEFRKRTCAGEANQRTVAWHCDREVPSRDRRAREAERAAKIRSGARQQLQDLIVYTRKIRSEARRSHTTFIVPNDPLSGGSLQSWRQKAQTLPSNQRDSGVRCEQVVACGC